MVLLSKKKIDSLTPSDLDIQTRKIRFFEQIGKKSQHCVLHTLEQVASLTLIGMTLKVTLKHEAGVKVPSQPAL